MDGGIPSPLGAALRLAIHGLRGRGGGTGRPAAPRRRAAVERDSIVVDPERVRRYLDATGGGGIEALRGPDAPFPPTLPALWETTLALELMREAEIPFPRRGLIHVGSEMVSLRPLRAGDRVRCRVELDGLEPHPKGIRLELRSRNWNGGGQLCQENTLSVLLPGPGEGARGGGRRKGEESPTVERAEWSDLAGWTLAGSQGRRYARVSGDYNPIHLWGWTARVLGYRRPILHGFCLEAMVAHALVEHALRGDPLALRRLSIRFRAPLHLPARVRLQLSVPTGARRDFRVLDPDLPRPFAEGEFVGASAQG